MSEKFYATGRRKNSIAKVWLSKNIVILRIIIRKVVRSRSRRIRRRRCEEAE